MIELLKIYAVNGTKHKVIDEPLPMSFNTIEELETYKKQIRKKFDHEVDIQFTYRENT